jgi:thioredoxin-dependent peroxiredoxin
MLKVGDAAPDFTVRTHEDTPFTLSRLRGGKVLLWFYPKADTPGCTIEGRGFRDQQADFRALGVTVVGTSVDSVEENAAFARRYDFPFLLLCDTDRAVALAYGACEDPRAPNARRISYLIGEDGTVARVYEDVNPKDHPAKVLLDLIGG